MNKAQIEAALKRLHSTCKAAADKAELEYKEGSVKAETKGDEQVFELRGVFDGGWWGVDVQKVISEMSDRAKTIRLIIDSPGGFVDEGRSLYSELRTRADKGQKIITEGRALVASAAVLPLVAGDERTVEQSTLVMIHNPWGFLFAVGDRDELKSDADKTIKALDAYTNSYIDVLAERTSLNKTNAKDAMKEETWYDADAAVDKGFVASIASASEDPDVNDAVAKGREKFAAAILKGVAHAA